MPTISGQLDGQPMQFMVRVFLQVMRPIILYQSEAGLNPHKPLAPSSTYLHLLIYSGNLYIYVFIWRFTCLRTSRKTQWPFYLIQHVQVFDFIFFKPLCYCNFIILYCCLLGIWIPANKVISFLFRRIGTTPFGCHNPVGHPTQE